MTNGEDIAGNSALCSLPEGSSAATIGPVAVVGVGSGATLGDQALVPLCVGLQYAAVVRKAPVWIVGEPEHRLPTDIQLLPGLARPGDRARRLAPVLPHQSVHEMKAHVFEGNDNPLQVGGTRRRARVEDVVRQVQSDAAARNQVFDQRLKRTRQELGEVLGCRVAVGPGLAQWIRGRGQDDMNRLIKPCEN